MTADLSRLRRAQQELELFIEEIDDGELPKSQTAVVEIDISTFDAVIRFYDGFGVEMGWAALPTDSEIDTNNLSRVRFKFVRNVTFTAPPFDASHHALPARIYDVDEIRKMMKMSPSDIKAWTRLGDEI